MKARLYTVRVKRNHTLKKYSFINYCYFYFKILSLLVFIIETKAKLQKNIEIFCNLLQVLFLIGFYSLRFVSFDAHFM